MNVNERTNKMLTVFAKGEIYMHYRTFPEFLKSSEANFCTLICVVLSERECKKPAKSKFLYLFFSDTVIYFSCHCQTLPKSYSPEINRASPFSSLTILMNGKGFKRATANDNVEWTDHVLRFKTTCSGSIPTRFQCSYVSKWSSQKPTF